MLGWFSCEAARASRKTAHEVGDHLVLSAATLSPPGDRDAHPRRGTQFPYRLCRAHRVFDNARQPGQSLRCEFLVLVMQIKKIRKRAVRLNGAASASALPQKSDIKLGSESVSRTVVGA